MSCAFWTVHSGGGGEGKTVSSGSYTLDQFSKCLKCKHFMTFYEDYQCNRPGGKACLLGEVGLYEEKNVTTVKKG